MNVLKTLKQFKYINECGKFHSVFGNDDLYIVEIKNNQYIDSLFRFIKKVRYDYESTGYIVINNLNTIYISSEKIFKDEMKCLGYKEYYVDYVYVKLFGKKEPNPKMKPPYVI